MTNFNKFTAALSMAIIVVVMVVAFGAGTLAVEYIDAGEVTIGMSIIVVLVALITAVLFIVGKKASEVPFL